MARAPHAADHRDAAWIKAATHFNAMVFLGRGQYDREDDIPTLAEAKAAAARIEARNPGRSAMIYAVTAEGRSCLVTAQLEALMTMQDSTDVIGKDYSARSAAIRAMKRAGLDPDQAEVRAYGKRWVIRRPGDSADALTDKPATPEARPLRRTSVLRAQEDARAQAAAAKRAPKAKAAAKAKPAPAPKAARTAAPGRPSGQAPKRGAKAYEAALEAARAGKLPAAPDFSAETHKPYRAKLARVSELAAAGDAIALASETASWKPYNSSMAPLIRYRDLCLEALAAKGRG